MFHCAQVARILAFVLFVWEPTAEAINFIQIGCDNVPESNGPSGFPKILDNWDTNILTSKTLFSLKKKCNHNGVCWSCVSEIDHKKDARIPDTETRLVVKTATCTPLAGFVTKHDILCVGSAALASTKLTVTGRISCR